MALALLLAQAPLTAAQIHAEDAKVFEAALLGYWAQGQPESETLYVPDLTFYSARGGDPIQNEEYDVHGKRVGKVAFDPALRESLKERNAYPVSIAWFRPQSAKIKVVGAEDRKIRGVRRRLRQHSWLFMPGYSKDRTQAIVCFSFNWSIHPGQATVWLVKPNGVWKVTGLRDVHYV